MIMMIRFMYSISSTACREGKRRQSRLGHSIMEDLLAQELSKLSLDYGTYGGYVLPLITSEEDDADEWESVLELLQASVEDEENEDVVGAKMKKFQLILKEQRQLYLKQQQQEQEHEAQARQEALQRELQLERQRAAEEHEKLQHQLPKERNDDDAAKKALLSRFAYEVPDEGVVEAQPVTNSQIARELNKAKVQTLRQAQATSKADECAKTKEMKASKEKAKEERRKRAIKGERKR